MKTIKLIDLLNKIANGEEVPKRIRYEYKDYVYKDNYEDYYCEEESRYLFEIIVNDENWKLSYTMNIEVEILEEEKKIPERVSNAEVFEVPKLNNMELSNIALTNKEDIKIIKDTLNKVLDYLKSKGDE